jgi:mannose-6-phosphate isomerase-like protein (cupin superfamily)
MLEPMAVTLIPSRPLDSRNDLMPGRAIIEAAPGGWSGVALSEWELNAAAWTDRHPHDEINYVLAGELHVESDGETVVAHAGDTVWVRAGSTGTYTAPVHARMLAIYGPNPDGAESDSFEYRTLKNPATAADVHDLAAAMPHVTVDRGPLGNAVYQVGGKTFVFFRNPRPDAVDPDTGERYDDVIVFWVESDADKEALVQDPSSPFFTTPHFNGHRSVLVRASRLGELSRDELAEVVQDAWLARASPARARTWIAARDTAQR